MLTRVDAPVALKGFATARWYWQFLRDPLQAVAHSHARYGPFVKLPHPHAPGKPGRAFLIAVGPTFNREVLGNPAAWRTVQIGPGGPRNSAAQRLGLGIIRMTGRPHEYYRQLLLPPLQRKSVEIMGADMIRLTHEEIESWPIDCAIDVWAHVRKLMRTLAIGLLFGDDRPHGYPIADMINQGADYNWSWKVVACPLLIPGTPYHTMINVAEDLERRILNWADCKRGNLGRRDLLALIVNSPDENGNPVSDARIAGHMPTLFGATYETCQNALIWTLILLDQHPKVAGDLFDELRSGGAPPSFDQVMQLPLLDAVVKESMRILPPVPQQFRVAERDTTLNGFPIAARTRVLLSSFLTNRESDFYPEADRFKPERWATISPSPYEYSVFSGGPRGCPGYALGASVVKVAIAMIMSRYRVALGPNAQIDYKVKVTLSPRRPVPAVLRRQDGAFVAAPIRGAVRNLVQFPD